MANEIFNIDIQYKYWKYCQYLINNEKKAEEIINEILSNDQLMTNVKIYSIQ